MRPENPGWCPGITWPVLELPELTVVGGEDGRGHRMGGASHGALNQLRQPGEGALDIFLLALGANILASLRTPERASR